jgi:hypothetical protein
MVLARKHGQAAQEIVQQALQDPNYYVRKHAAAMVRVVSSAPEQPSEAQKPAQEQKTNGSR